MCLRYIRGLLNDVKMGCLVQIPFKLYIGTVSMLPFSAFVICILWSVLKNYEESTSTHCHVQNYLPSISTAVGTFPPQKYIWRMCIALHCTPRILIAVMYYNYFRNMLPKEYFWQRLAFIAYVFQNTEILSLIGLSYISSSEDFPTHQKLFITFVISALLSMILLYTLLKHGLYHQKSRLERKSVRLKFILLTLNFSAFVLSVYFYIRHNMYCEPGMYTLFALAEYVVVLSNIAFHFTATWDFSNKFISVISM